MTKREAECYYQGVRMGLMANAYSEDGIMYVGKDTLLDDAIKQINEKEQMLLKYIDESSSLNANNMFHISN